MSESPVEQVLAQRLGAQIAGLRLSRNLSQEALAEAAGISANHLQLLESGLSDRKKRMPANPRLSTLVALSTALDVTLPKLLDAALSTPEHESASATAAEHRRTGR